ncbi:MAG TPA: class I SAM-dependent methyltransferase [Longimicrobiales bacterium]
MSAFEIAACPVCATSDFSLLADANSIKRQIEALWEFHTRRIRPGAPVQQLFDRAIFSQHPPVHVVQCCHCGTVLRNPREAGEDIVDSYASEAPPEAALPALFAEQLAFYRPRVRKLTGMLGRGGSVLEVGSYVGGFLLAASDAGWQAEGIDVNTAANAFAAARGCTVSVATIDAWQTNRRYDVVAFWNCFDQLPDARAALVRAYELLAAHGLLVLRVPNGACYAALLDAPLGRTLLAHNNLLGFPYRNGFTVRALQKLADDVGFRATRARGDTLVSTASVWTRSWTLLEQRALKLAMRRLLPTRIAPWLEFFAWKS